MASHLVLLRSAKDAFVELKPIFSANDFSVSTETRAFQSHCTASSEVTDSHDSFLLAPLTNLIGFTERYVKLCELLVKEVVIWEAWRACGADRDDIGLEQREGMALRSNAAKCDEVN